MSNQKIELKMATWSFRIGHIHIGKEFELPNGVLLPSGTLCGREPTKLIGKNPPFALILFPLGSVHVLGLPVCKNCIYKALKYYSNLIADTVGLPAGV